MSLTLRRSTGRPSDRVGLSTDLELPYLPEYELVFLGDFLLPRHRGRRSPLGGLEA